MTFSTKVSAFLVPIVSVRLPILTLPAVERDAGVEPITFPDEGGTSDLGLAIPYLPDMDGVVVDEAAITIRAADHPITVEPASIHTESGATYIDLGHAGRLTAIDISFPAPLIKTEPGKERILLSTAEPGSPEAPIMVTEPFENEGSVYPTALTGMTLSGGEETARLTFDRPVAGSRWALRVVSGTSAGELVPSPTGTLEVQRVEVDAAPTGLTVTIPEDDESTETVLYSNPATLLPEAGTHEVVFTPLAERRLRARLEAARDRRDEGLLGVPIRLASASAGAVAIESRSLLARYTVKATAEPIELEIGGDWAVLPLMLPAGRRPSDGGGALTVRGVRHELDPSFEPPSHTPPAGGVTVDPGRRIASAGTMTPGTSEPATLVAVRVLVATERPAEVVLELRADGSGLPGPRLASVVRRLAASPPAWQEFLLPAPLRLEAQARVWCILRTNDEPIRWYCGSLGALPRISVDDGKSWGAAATPLEPGGAPLLQLYRPAGPAVAPVIECFLGAQRIGEVTLAGAGGAYTGWLSLPGAVLAAAGATTGTGRARTELLLYSRTVMHATVRDLVCSYDPFAADA